MEPLSCRTTAPTRTLCFVAVEGDHRYTTQHQRCVLEQCLFRCRADDVRGAGRPRVALVAYRFEPRKRHTGPCPRIISHLLRDSGGPDTTHPPCEDGVYLLVYSIQHTKHPPSWMSNASAPYHLREPNPNYTNRLFGRNNHFTRQADRMGARQPVVHSLRHTSTRYTPTERREWMTISASNCFSSHTIALSKTSADRSQRFRHVLPLRARLPP